MQIITRNICQYLSKRHLLTQKELVDGGVALSMQRSRNRFISIKRKSGPSYFIKQALETEHMSATTVAREAAIYQGAFADARLQSLKQLLPNFYLFDEPDCVLITELVNHSVNISLHQSPTGPCDAAIAAKLGSAIAGFHEIRFAPEAPQPPLFGQQPPWILRFFKQKDYSVLRRSPACSGLIDIFLAMPELPELLGRLDANWVCDTLIHVDLKFENCLLSPSSMPVAEQALHIIDWELADIGDAAWDVGSILQAYLNLWIVSITPVAGASIEAMAAQASVPLARVQHAILIFWQAYAAKSLSYRPARREYLERCVSMMAARMLVTAFEASAATHQIDGRAFFMVQTALNVLKDPVQAIYHLLDLGASYDAAA